MLFCCASPAGGGYEPGRLRTLRRRSGRAALSRRSCCSKVPKAQPETPLGGQATAARRPANGCALLATSTRRPQPTKLTAHSPLPPPRQNR